MNTVIIVHRWGATPHSDWIPWLTIELESRGFGVIVPAMPDTDEPRIDSWVNYLKDIDEGVINGDVIFLGHSIGCQAIMRYLETRKKPAKSAIFVAGWFDLDNLETDEDREIVRPWIETPINFPAVRANLKSPAAVLLSTNEPYGHVIENTESFRDNLGATVAVLNKMGHFTAEDGFTEFPLLLETVQEIANE